MGSNRLNQLEFARIGFTRFESVRNRSNVSLFEAEPFGINLVDAPRVHLISIESARSFWNPVQFTRAASSGVGWARLEAMESMGKVPMHEVARCQRERPPSHALRSETALMEKLESARNGSSRRPIRLDTPRISLSPLA